MALGKGHSRMELIILNLSAARRKTCGLNRPSITKSTLNLLVIQIEMLTNLNQTSSETTNGNNFVSISVPCLLNTSGPSTIRRFIISVLVRVTIDAFPGRTLSHIGQKLFKRVPPFFANLYPSASVAWKRFGFWIGASLNHVLPCTISASSPKLSVPMFHFGFRDQFCSETSTRFSFTGNEGIVKHDTLFPTIASAETLWMSTPGWSDLSLRLCDRIVLAQSQNIAL